jgi:NNP family nitrate/nitrite transporter-like MFS transporter
MIPAIFAELGRRDPTATLVDYKRRAAAAIGICGAIGAFGGFLIQVAFRQASLSTVVEMKAATTPVQKAAIAHAHAGWSIPALWVFLGAYVVLGGLTWFCYLRRSVGTARIPSLASAAV